MGKKKEIEVHIDSEEISNYLFAELVKRGFSPTQDETDELADIVFDYLLDKNIIDEQDVEDY